VGRGLAAQCAFQLLARDLAGCDENAAEAELAWAPNGTRLATLELENCITLALREVSSLHQDFAQLAPATPLLGKHILELFGRDAFGGTQQLAQAQALASRQGQYLLKSIETIRDFQARKQVGVRDYAER
jgi:hypothetical protein